MQTVTQIYQTFLADLRRSASQRSEAQAKLLEMGLTRIQFLERELAAKETLSDRYRMAALQGLAGSRWAEGRHTDQVLARVEDLVRSAMKSRMGEPPVEQVEPALPIWEPCNPGCDPDLGGSRSRHCLCAKARAALNPEKPEGETL